MRFILYICIALGNLSSLVGANSYTENCDKDFYKLSIICSGRNDDYGGNFLNRLEYFLRSVDRLTIPVEIILVEWNPIQNQLKLSDIIKIWNERLNYKNPIVVIEVSKENHDKFCSYYNQGDTRYTFHEYAAKNVGFRHAKGKYIIQTNPDNFYCRKTLDHIEEIVCTEMDDIIIGEPVRTDINNVTYYQCLIDLTSSKELENCLKRLDGNCARIQGGHRTGYGDFMLFKREKVLKAKGFPEFPYGIHHFEQPFIDAFFRTNPKSQIKRLDGFTVYHFDHSRWGGGGINTSSDPHFLSQSQGKHPSLGCPNPAPINDENWGLVNLNLKKTVIKST